LDFMKKNFRAFQINNNNNNGSSSRINRIIARKSLKFSENPINRWTYCKRYSHLKIKYFRVWHGWRRKMSEKEI
jgi:hypothetical protein